MRSGNICDSQTLCKKCDKCDKLASATKKREKAVQAKNQKKINKYTKREKKLTGHVCYKNWTKSSKAMESETIVRLVKKAPKKLGCYVRYLVMDDDTTTPAQLREDEGEDSKGRLPKRLTGIFIYADPSHRKRTWQNWFYKLAGLKKKKCNVNKVKAKKIGIDMGYWIFQAKSLTFDDLQKQSEAPLRHWCGDHALCGEWCYSLRAEKEGKMDAKKPLFNVNDEADKSAIDQVRSVQESFTTFERLKQMWHFSIPSSTRASTCVSPS